VFVSRLLATLDSLLKRSDRPALLVLDLLHREKAAEKRPVAPQCKTEILGRDIIAAIPLALEFRPFSREHFSQALHRYCDKIICLLHCSSRLVNKTHLDRIPPRTEILCFFKRKQRRCLLVNSRSGCRSGR